MNTSSEAEQEVRPWLAPAWDDPGVKPDPPTERELRLLGDLRGKRVLDLGSGDGSAAIAFAHQGAIVIALDGSDARLAQARERAERDEGKGGGGKGDLA